MACCRRFLNRFETYALHQLGSLQVFIQRANDNIAELFSPTASSATAEPSVSLWDRVIESDSPILRYMEPYFAPLGGKVRTGIEDGKLTWTRLASGDGPNERIFAVLLGYFVVALLVALYLNVLTIGNVKNAGQAVRNAVRQQLLVVKVRRTSYHARVCCLKVS